MGCHFGGFGLNGLYEKMLVRWELVIWEIYLVVRSCMGVCVCMWLVGEVVRM